jgi:hypothetical protein
MKAALTISCARVVLTSFTLACTTLKTAWLKAQSVSRKSGRKSIMKSLTGRASVELGQLLSDVGTAEAS